MKITSRRIVQFSILVFILFELAYLIAVSILLDPKRFDSILKINSDNFSLKFASGHSWFPGWVTLTDVDLNGQDPNLRWHIHVPHVQARLSLSNLLRKQLHLHSVKIHTVDFDLKMKSENEKGPSKSPKPIEERKQSWKLIFDGVSIEQLGKVDLDGFLFQGKTSLKGRLELWPGVETEIGPVTIDLESGDIFTTDDQKAAGIKESQKLESKDSKKPGSTKDSKVAKDDDKEYHFVKNLKSHIEVKIDRLQLDDAEGAKILDYFNVDAEISGDVHGRSILDYYLRQTPNIHILDSEGDFKAKIVVNKGVFDESFYEAQSPKMRLSSKRINVEGKSHLLWKVTKTGEQAKSRLELNFKDIDVSFNKSKNHLIHGQKLDMVAETFDLELKSLFSSMNYTIDLPQAQIPDVKNWNLLFAGFPFKLALQSGEGTIEAYLQAEAKKPNKKESAVSQHSKTEKKSKSSDKYKPGKNFLQFQLKDLHGCVQESTFHGLINGKIDFDFIDLGKMKTLVSSIFLGLDQVQWNYQGRKGTVEIKDWKATTQLSSVLLNFGETPSLEANAVLDTTQSKPILDLFDHSYHFPDYKYRFLEVKPLHLGFSVQLDPGGVDLKEFELESETLHSKGHLRYFKKQFWGAVKLRVGILSFGVKLMGKDSEFKVFPSDDFVKKGPETDPKSAKK